MPFWNIAHKVIEIENKEGSGNNFL